MLYDHPVVLVSVCLFVCPYFEIGLMHRKMVVDCPPVITSIVDTRSFVLLISNTFTHLLESETKLALGDALTALALGLLHPVN